MGAYINPPNQTKELWLEENGKLNNDVPYLNLTYYNEYIKDMHKMFVCLMNNGPFTAAGIAYNTEELKAFNSPIDSRPKTWYLVPIEKLWGVSNLKDYYKEYNMSNTIFHSIVEKNGKTIKENNLQISHQIPIGTLVELTSNYDYGWEKCRLYVVQHTRDCDGTPLYGIGFRDATKPYEIFGGFSDENLKVIT